MLSDPFVMCSRLLTYAKDSGLVVGSYGNLNDELECALVSVSYSRILGGGNILIFVIYRFKPKQALTNKVRLISETLAKATNWASDVLDLVDDRNSSVCSLCLSGSCVAFVHRLLLPEFCLSKRVCNKIRVRRTQDRSTLFLYVYTVLMYNARITSIQPTEYIQPSHLKEPYIP